MLNLVPAPYYGEVLVVGVDEGHRQTDLAAAPVVLVVVHGADPGAGGYVQGPVPGQAAEAVGRGGAGKTQRRFKGFLLFEEKEKDAGSISLDVSGPERYNRLR